MLDLLVDDRFSLLLACQNQVRARACTWQVQLIDITKKA
jgi:hypothetical protein